jgi:hypothetical protein
MGYALMLTEAEAMLAVRRNRARTGPNTPKAQAGAAHGFGATGTKGDRDTSAVV